MALTLFLFVSAACFALPSVLAQGSSTGVQSCSCSVPCTATGVATYTVEFEFTWPAANYRIPPSPHWSPPVYTTHSPCAVVWRVGVQSTNGVEVLAESGSPGVVGSEVSGLGNRHRSYVTGSLLFSAAGTDTRTVTADRFRPLLSTLSMIAPSPDWFVGVDSVPLCINDTFIERVSYNLYPFDTASDSGTTYTASDADMANGNIFRILPSSGTDVFEANGQASIPMGQLHIRRTNLDSSATVPTVTCNACSAGTSCGSSFDDGRALNLAVSPANTASLSSSPTSPAITSPQAAQQTTSGQGPVAQQMSLIGLLCAMVCAVAASW